MAPVGTITLPEDGLAAARAHWQQGRPAQALGLCRRLLQERPQDAPVLHLLGCITGQLGQPALAVALLGRAVALAPGVPPFHASLAAALLERGEWEEALAGFRRVLRIDPGSAEALLGAGVALICLRRWEEAEDSFQHALALAPAAAQARFPLGSVLLLQLLLQGGWEEAGTTFRRALAIVRDFPYAGSSLLFALHYLPSCDRETLLGEARAWAARHAGPPAGEIRPHRNSPDPERRLRIGYVSADLRRHPVGYFLEPILAAHDRRQVEVFCYAGSPIADDLTERLRAACDHWRNIAGASDEQAATRIQDDGIDLLIDLSGHTAEHRLPLFARKPAPVQATWLGYFDTTGMACMDALIGDRFVCPRGDDARYVEQVVRLPDGYLCYRPQTAPDVTPLPALARGHVTFGCFNALAKVTPRVASLWAEILRALPGTRLCLKCGEFDHPGVRERCVRLFGECGVTPDRLRLLGKSPYTEYLAAYGEIDIALDPFPYNGGTTTVEALWMGVPVVSLAGDRFVSRMGLTHLSAVGLPDLVAGSPREYVGKAIALAGDVARLAGLRAGLRQRVAQSPLCDEQRFTRGLETAYRDMWRRWCR